MEGEGRRGGEGGGEGKEEGKGEGKGEEIDRGLCHNKYTPCIL